MRKVALVRGEGYYGFWDQPWRYSGLFVSAPQEQLWLIPPYAPQKHLYLREVAPSPLRMPMQRSGQHVDWLVLQEMKATTFPVLLGVVALNVVVPSGLMNLRPGVESVQ